MQLKVRSFAKENNEQTDNVPNANADATNVEQNIETNKEVSENTTEIPVEPSESITKQTEPQVVTETKTEPESSLTSESVNQVTQPQSFNPKEEELLKHLSDKLGMELNSLEDLKPKEVNIDPQVKALNEWKEKTGRPIEDFFKFNKDYSSVSDIDIAREALKLEYPTLSKEDIELELSTKFISDEDDLDIEVARKNLELKKYATKGRQALEQMKGDLGKPNENILSPEIKEQVEFAKEIKKQIQANKEHQENYTKGIVNATNTVESLSLSLADDFKIDYKVSPEDRKTLPDFIQEMPHWINQDGSTNHQEVVKDSIKIKNFDNIVKLAYEQGLSAGKDQVIKDAKNTTIDQSNNMNAQQSTGKKKPIYENEPKGLGGSRMSVKFNK